MIEYLTQLGTADLLIVAITLLLAWIALCITIGVTAAGLIAR